MDVLLHSLSHADMLLGIGEENVLARPKFNQFHYVSKLVFDFVSENQGRFRICVAPAQRRKVDQQALDLDLENEVAIGFDFSGVVKRPSCELFRLRLRHEAAANEGTSSKSTLFLQPLFIVLLLQVMVVVILKPYISHCWR